MFTKRLEILATIDPSRVTVEDVERLLGCYTWMAKAILKTAVRRGEFGLNEDGTYHLIT